jgi:hypothetical protein
MRPDRSRTRFWSPPAAWPHDWEGSAPAVEALGAVLLWVGCGSESAAMLVHFRRADGQVRRIRLSRWREAVKRQKVPHGRKEMPDDRC